MSREAASRPACQSARLVNEVGLARWMATSPWRRADDGRHSTGAAGGIRVTGPPALRYACDDRRLRTHPSASGPAPCSASDRRTRGHRPGVPVLSTTPPDRAAGLPPAGAIEPATPPTWGSAAPATATADAAVVVDDVTMRFDDQLAVDGISPGRPAGTILGLIGPSGAGKTTTIRLLTGALTPTSGTVRVLGEEPRRFRRQTRERLGYMPQSFTLYPDLTVRENVDFVASLFGMMFPRRRRRTREVLQLARPVGRPEPASRAAVRRHAAPARARVRARPRSRPAVPRRADGRDRPAAARRASGRSSTGCARPAGRCSSRPSTSTRPSRATSWR